MTNSIRNYFPGGNTSEGFYSYYKYVLHTKDAKRIIYLKGGPGTGKSTLMKKLGMYFHDKGYDIEFHHCSSDNNSLDGVVIKNLNTAVIDGTSPHMIDPKNPGAVDEIINLGSFWKENSFQESREKIINTNNSIKETFDRAYKYLQASKLIYESWSFFNSKSVNIEMINLLKESLKNNILKNDICETGYARHLFSTAFTPNGIVTYIDDLCKGYENIYVLNGEPGTHKSNILEYLCDEALKRGHYIEVLHHPLIPSKIEHVLIPELKTAVLTSNEINKKHLDGKQIYMLEAMNTNISNLNKNNIDEDKKMFYILLDNALSCIKNAKKLHDELETYYIPNMNFDKLNDLYEKLIIKFENY